MNAMAAEGCLESALHTIVANVARPSDLWWGAPGAQSVSVASWSEVHHLEGERARYPRGRNHVSQHRGQRAPWGVQGRPAGRVVWKRWGGLEATLVLPRSHMVALVHQLLLLMEHGVSFKPSCLIYWCFVPSLPPK